MIKTIKIFGDKYILRKTFDILDYIGGVYGLDILDSNRNLLFHLDGENEDSVKSEIKWIIYRNTL